jgi:hypothetical protein
MKIIWLSQRELNEVEESALHGIHGEDMEIETEDPRSFLPNYPVLSEADIDKIQEYLSNLESFVYIDSEPLSLWAVAILTECSFGYFEYSSPSSLLSVYHVGGRERKKVWPPPPKPQKELH